MNIPLRKSGDASDERRTFLSFQLGDECFAMDVACVREILDPCPVTRVPASAPHMRGVINVRGIATAVMDLRERFGLGPCPGGPEERIIIMEFEHEGETVTVGGLADAVREVLDLSPAQINPPPGVGMTWNADFVRGVAHRDSRYLILLDMPRLLTSAAGEEHRAPCPRLATPL